MIFSGIVHLNNKIPGSFIKYGSRKLRWVMRDVCNNIGRSGEGSATSWQNSHTITRVSGRDLIIVLTSSWGLLAEITYIGRRYYWLLERVQIVKQVGIRVVCSIRINDVFKSSVTFLIFKIRNTSSLLINTQQLFTKKYCLNCIKMLMFKHSFYKNKKSKKIH